VLKVSVKRKGGSPAVRHKRGRYGRNGKNTAWYSQALELDVEFLHLHFLPRLQLKNTKVDNKQM